MKKTILQSHLAANDFAKNPTEIIHQTFKEIGCQLGLRLELLKHCAQTIPILTEWEYNDWHSYDPSLTREFLIEGFEKCLNDDRLPLVIVAFKKDIPIGVISLHERAEPELADLEDGNPWGGSFHVIPTERGRGLGEDLAATLVILAKRLGYETIHFFTSNPRAAKWYSYQGAEVLGMRAFRGHTITVMKFLIQNPTH